MIGIDFGTTTSEIAVFKGGSVTLLSDLHGDQVIPSAQAIPPFGDEIFGSKALARRTIDPANTLTSVKRRLGLGWFDQEAADFRRTYTQFEFDRSAEDLPAFRTRRGLRTATEATRDFLAWLARCPARPPSDRAVVTVPVTFTGAQRDLICHCAREAGFAAPRSLEEPMAAALPYLKPDGRERIVAVYDLGGGTFDFAVLRTVGLDYEVLAAGGEPYLGGDDLDRALADWAVMEILRTHRWDVRTSPQAYARLVLICQQAKVRLSKIEKTRIPLSTVDPVLSGRAIELHRSALDEAVAGLIQKTLLVCDQVLNEAGLTAARIDLVVAAGGTTYLPGIRKAMALYFGRPAVSDQAPDQVVALGAALAAAAAEPPRALTVA